MKKLWLVAGFTWAAFIGLTLAVSAGLTLTMDNLILSTIHEFHNAGLDLSMSAITALGDPVTVAVFMVALFAYLAAERGQLFRAIGTSLVVFGAMALSIIGKLLFVRARPELWERVVHEASFSYPSGHAMGSLALTLVIIYLARNTTRLPLAILIGSIYVVLIGLSRLYLGVHYPSDVLGGWLLTLAWVGSCLILVHFYKRYKS